MRLLLISIFCLILFFPTYWALHPILGPNWGAGLALLLSWLLLPVFLLRKWSVTKNRFLIAGNYILALLVLGFSTWVLYHWLIQGFELEGSVRLLFIYFFCSVYYLAQGHMPYQKGQREGGNST